MSQKFPNPPPAKVTKEAVYDSEGKHYKMFYNGVLLDPYRICTVYNITNPAHQHAIKKLLRAGNSIKSLEQDIDEVIVTLNRWKQMIQEDRV